MTILDQRAVALWAPLLVSTIVKAMGESLAANLSEGVIDEHAPQDKVRAGNGRKTR